MTALADHVPERFLTADGQLAEPFSREEVEDLFAPGTIIRSRNYAYTVDALVSGPDLLGTVEDDSSLWITFEQATAAFEVGNGLQALTDGAWTIGDSETVAQTHIECSECDKLVHEARARGQFVPDRAFCSEACLDDYLDRETAHADNSI